MPKALNYMLPDEFKLAIYIPSLEKTFVSDKINRENFRSSYNANIQLNGSVSVQETTSFIQSDDSGKYKDFILALIITLFLELMTVIIFINFNKANIERYSGSQTRLLLTILLANIISLPIVWFVFPLLKLDILLIVFVAEVFAFLFEGIFIFKLNKSLIPLKNAMILSLSMNLMSIFAGIPIFAFLLFFRVF